MKNCPACKYERTEQDGLLFPDYECPSCGIIFEKDKARQELEELEKQRQKERQAKLERLKKEEEQKRRREEALLRKKEQERQEKEKIKRLQEQEAERQLQAETEQKRRVEEERLRLEAEEKLRLEMEAQKRQEQEAAMLRKERQEEIVQTAQESPDRIISSPETEKAYQLFDMCPFGTLHPGKGLSLVGFGEAKNKLQHTRCMQKYCRLWTWKTDAEGEIYGQGCSLQFLGLNREEIKNNFFIKNKQILEDAYPGTEESADPDGRE